jgi:Flp pilus assembly protein TadG
MSGTHLIKRLARHLRLFRGDQRGNVAVIVGAAIIPLVGALGLATDTARGFLTKARLSQALDSAALAGGKVYFSVQRDDDIKKFFAANFPSTALPEFGVPYDARFMNAEVILDAPVEGGESGKENLTLTAQATVPTTFMRVLGFETVTVNATAQVTRAINALDVVISLDMSGSMKNPNTKIEAARDAAVSFVDTVFGDNTESPTLTIDGTTYNLLNMGFVPWNHKVRVTTEGAGSLTTVTTENVGNFTNPVTGQTQSNIYWANNSQVPLLRDPRSTSSGGHLPGGWSGCIYARYLGDAYNDNDGDIVRGPVTLGSGAGQRQWLAWEPMAVYDAEPRSGSWTSSEGPSGTRWTDGSSGYTNRSCYNAYFNDAGSTHYDNADGSIRSYSSSDTSRPAAVPNPRTVGSNSSGFLKFWADSGNGSLLSTESYARPNIGSTPGSSDCAACLSRGIIPLTSTKATIRNQLSGIALSDPQGNTNIAQGLYWAWEVLMPGVPFTQAVETVPFKRIRAIILLTDGEQVGGNGDAYKGRFGSGTGAGTNTNAAHGEIDYRGDMVQNNLNNRLRVLADNVKEEGIKLYVIAFNLAGNTTALDLLEEIASAPDESGEYFFDAPDPSDLESVFAQIAASLSSLRLSN